MFTSTSGVVGGGKGWPARGLVPFWGGALASQVGLSPLRACSGELGLFAGGAMALEFSGGGE